jgi:superfamily II DNA or RNA helicase
MNGKGLAAWLDTLREECLPAVWSRGVSLARSGEMARNPEAEAEDPGAIHVLVPAPRRSVPVHVVLVPEEAEWGSDCDCRDDPCEHDVAAALAWHDSLRSGEGLGAAVDAPARLAYRLTLAGGGLLVRRVAVTRTEEIPLNVSCRALERGTPDLPPTRITPPDHRVEEILGGPRPEPVPPGRLRPLLAALRRCEDVRWEGRAVEPSPEPVFPWAVVEDAAEGWRIRLAPDPELTRVIGGGLALCGDRLRPIGESRLTAAERQQLARGALYPRKQAARLVGEVLPRLEARIPVLRRTRSLPGRSEDEPRLLIELERDPESDRVTARPYIVYGDPPAARVAGGELEHLRGDVPQRDPQAERRLEHRLGAAGLASGLEESAPGDEGIALVQRVAGLPAEIVGMRPEQRRIHDETLDPSLGLAEDGSLRASFTTTGGRAAAEAVVAAWRNGREYAPLLEERGWARLPQEWLTRHGERLADLLAGRDEGGRLRGAARVDACGLLEEIGAPVPEGDRERRARLIDATGPTGAAEAELHGDLRATLRAYQRDGVRWLTTLRRARLGALLADDMGLGKTLQVIASLPEGARSLVVCPTSVIHEWREQIARFRPALGVATHHGPDRRLMPGADVTLTSYALLRIDVEALAAVEWDALVVDEAQAVKNPDSQVARAARRVPARWKVALTGTPVENRLEDVWSQMAVLNPGLLGSRRDFERRYARPISRGDEQAAARLSARLRPFVLRRTKDQVAPELPERTEVVRRCVLSEEEREIYQGLRAATRAEVVRQLDGGASALGALEALLRLRQAACHPGLLPGERWTEASTSAKVDELLGLLDTVAADGHRALVFSQWTRLLDLIEPPMHRAGHTWLRLDGSTPDREDVVARFQDPAGPPFLLISLKAGGTGLNLTAADHVVLLDPWWNPAVEDQAADRAHRIGRTRPVIVHRLVASETVEERLLALQQEKRAVAAAALEGAAGAASLTREDLLSLLA